MTSDSGGDQTFREWTRQSCTWLTAPQGLPDAHAIVKDTSTKTKTKSLTQRHPSLGAWSRFGFASGPGSGFQVGIGFSGTLLLARAPLLVATLLSHTILSPAFTSVWWSD
jgi:hypothetical protein